MTMRKNATGGMGDLAHSLTVGSWLFTVLVIFLLFFPSVERKFFPVMVNGQWGHVIEEVDGGIIVSASATKVRGCGWKETEFFLGIRNGLHSAMPRARHMDPPAVNDVGDLVWSRIFLPVTRFQFEQGFVYADSLHDCYGLDHLSRSRLFN